MANEFINWLHKKVDQVGHDINNDVVHPVEQAAQDVAKPVEQTAQKVAQPVIHAAQPVFHAANAFVQHPYIPAPAKVATSFTNDVVKPVANFAKPYIAAPPKIAHTAIDNTVKPLFHVADKAFGDTGHVASAVGKVGLDVGKDLASPFAYLGKSDIIDPARELVAQVSGNKQAEANATRASNEELGLGANGKDLGGALRKWAGNTAQVGLDVATPEASKGIEAALDKVGAKVIPDAISHAVPKAVADFGTKTAKNAITGSAVMTPFNIAGLVANPNAKLNAKNLETATKQGVIEGAALGAGGTLAGAAYHAVSPIVADHLSQALDAFHANQDKLRASQVGAVGKDVNDIPEGEVIKPTSRTSPTEPLSQEELLSLQSHSPEERNSQEETSTPEESQTKKAPQTQPHKDQQTSQNLSVDQEKHSSDADNTTEKTISPVSGREVHPEALDKFKDDGGYTEHPNGDISYKGKTYTAEQWQQLKDDGVNTPYGQEASASEIKEMDAKNPVKVNVEKTEAGDYAHARAVPQQASVPTRIATYLAARAAKQADLSTGELADMVEHPEDHTDLTPKQAKAVERYTALTNRINATSHAVGGTEKQLDNYFNHHIDTSTWKKTEDGMLIDPNTGKIYDPEDFRGVNATHRLTDENGKMVFPDVRSLNKAGYHLVDEDKNASKAINEYGGKAASKLEKQALKKAFTEADAGQKDQTHPIDLDDHSDAPLMLSKTGQNEIKGYLNAHGGKLLDAVDKVGSPIKHVLLSASQYHPININLLTAAPSLIMRGHPLMAARGLADTVRTAFSKEYSDRLLEEDLKSGLVEKAAKIGMPYGRSDFTTSGIASKMGETVFGRQIPAMYRQVAKATVDQLEKNDISLDSQTARDLGRVGNTTMGFVNRQAQNFSSSLQRILSNFFLAPQFEESKLMILKDAFVPNSVSAKLGMEGTSAIARRAAFATVFGKYAAEAATAVGLGALFHQKVNSVGDTLKEVAINPYVPTPFHNNSGANIKLKMPDSGASEIANIIGGVTRGKDKRLHLGVSAPSTDFTNLKQDIVDKASPLASAIAALATNKNYEGNPLSDPDLPATTQAQQKAASLITNFLPIGLQGLAYNKTIDQHLPTAVGQVLEANSPGTSPLLKSGLSTVALTPETDELSGKGLTDTQYYNALDKAESTLVPGSPAYGAFLENFGSTKDPVTGKYTEVPNSEMTVAKSASLNAYPAAAKAANSTMKQLAKDGQKVDPYYLLTPAQQKAYNSYETMAPLSADRTNWENNNKWYSAFATKEQNYFNSLPPGNPDKPANPIKYPTFSKSVTNQLNTYYALTNSTAKDTYLDNHPAVISAMNDQFKYDNAVRVARGYAPVKGYPTESAALQSQLKTYDSLSKSDQDTYAAAHPDIYNFFEEASQYDLIKDAGQNQFAGNNITPAEVKTINSLGDDIYYDGGLIGDNGQIVAPTGSSGSSSDSEDDYEDDSSGSFSPAVAASYFANYQHKPSLKKYTFAAPKMPKAVIKMPKEYLPAPKKVKPYVPISHVSVSKGAPKLRTTKINNTSPLLIT